MKKAPAITLVLRLWNLGTLRFREPALSHGRISYLPSSAENHSYSWLPIQGRPHIIDRPVIPGIDYALTEVVHCKSKSEVGVQRALKTCTEKHFDSIMRISPAKILVPLGKARARMREMYGIPNSSGVIEMEIGGRMRLIAPLGHPTGNEVRTFGAVYSSDLQRLRAAVCGKVS